MSDAAANPIGTADAETEEWKLPSTRKVGMASLILAESALFAIFVAAYLYYIGKSLSGPFPKDVLELPILATIFLLSSSGTILLAEKAWKKQSHSGFRLWWGVTILLGAAFIGMTALEWYGLIFRDGLTIGTNLFGSTFYPLVGLHATHVLIGLFLLGLVLGFSLFGCLKPEHGERLEMVSWYWHFVDAVWVVVFLVVYVIGM